MASETQKASWCPSIPHFGAFDSSPVELSTYYDTSSFGDSDAAGSSRLLFNKTRSPQAVDTAGYCDLYGNALANPLTLQSFEARIAIDCSLRR